MLDLTHSPAVRQYFAGVISTLAVASSGAAYLFLEPLATRMLEHREGVPVTVEEMSWLFSIPLLGGILSPVPASYLADRYGRKLSNLIVGPLCILSWGIILFTQSVVALYLVRVLQGIAIGIAFTVNPIYTAEISEPNRRGAISGLFQVALYAGCILSLAIGPCLPYNWYIICSIPLPLIFTVAFAFFPESPYWLIKCGKEEKAHKALKWLRPGMDIEREFQELKITVEEDTKGKSKSFSRPWKALFCDKYERKAFIIVQIVCTTKFFSGMATIVGYAEITFGKSDNFLTPEQRTILLGLLLAAIGEMSSVLSDRVGRKVLLLISCYGIFISHILTGSYHYLHEMTSVDTTNHGWMMYVGLVMYCLFLGIGLGPLPQALQAEMFGNETRELAGGITSITTAILYLIVTKCYFAIYINVGMFLNFWLYAFISLLGSVLLSMYMVETSGKVIGRIENKNVEIHNT